MRGKEAMGIETGEVLEEMLAGEDEIEILEGFLGWGERSENCVVEEIFVG